MIITIENSDLGHWVEELTNQSVKLSTRCENNIVININVSLKLVDTCYLKLDICFRFGVLLFAFFMFRSIQIFRIYLLTDILGVWRPFTNVNLWENFLFCLGHKFHLRIDFIFDFYVIVPYDCGDNNNNNTSEFCLMWFMMIWTVFGDIKVFLYYSTLIFKIYLIL